MKTIANIWFENGKIYMLCSDDKVYSRPLEIFPTLLDATEAERKNYTITMRGEAARWENLDEDIHISSFFETTTPEPVNEVAAIFNLFPQLNVSEVAKAMGIDKSLLASYIYGVKRPSKERLALIKETLHDIGNRLIAV